MPRRRSRAAQADLVDTAKSAGQVNDNVQGAMRKAGSVSQQVNQLPGALAGDVGDVAAGVGRFASGLFGDRKKAMRRGRRRGRA
jgi:hypothetical protein